MSTLQERRVLHCPYQRARSYLEAALKEPAEKQESKTIRLQVPIGPPGGVALNKEVAITVGAGKDPMHFDEPWAIHWEPIGGGPYPNFDGTLTVRADETYQSSLLELNGEYKPPLGAAGAAFDAVLGSRIASMTAQELLEKIGNEIERQYRAEEDAKAR